MIYIAKEIQASTADKAGSPSSTTVAQTSKECTIQGSNSWWYRTFLKYDLSGISSSAVILSAKMRVYDYFHNDNGGSGTTNISRITTDWDDNSVSWNNQPSWEGSYLSADVSPPGVGNWSDWDITSLVQKWMDGTYPNYGVYIKNNNEGSYRYDWHIRNHYFSEELASYLEIEYEAGDDIEPEPVYVYTLDFSNPNWATERADVVSVANGTTPFFVSSTLPYNDASTLRSGAISHGGTSETVITFVLVEDGSIEFNYTVSSEGNYDWLWAFIDGTQVVKVSGTVAWTWFSKTLSAGNHTLTLRYTKDGSGNTGSDAGAIGYIKFWGMVKPYDKRYLIRSEAVVYTVVDGALSALETSDVTAELFRSSGIEEPPASELLITLTDPEILYWVDTTECPIDEVKVIQTAIPFPQTLESPDYFMSDETVLGIEKAIAVATEDVQFAVSFDSGVTWKTFIEGVWAELSETASGMSATTLNAIPTESWNAMATNGKFRFRVSLMDETSEFTSLVVDYLNEAEVPAESNEGDE